VRRNVEVVLSITQLGAWVTTPELLGTVRVVRALLSHCGIPERPGYAGEEGEVSRTEDGKWGDARERRAARWPFAMCTGPKTPALHLASIWLLLPQHHP